jgi:hypothetical protein
MKITQANVQQLLGDVLGRLAFSLGENSDCPLQYYNLGAMISRAVIEAASNQSCGEVLLVGGFRREQEILSRYSKCICKGRERILNRGGNTEPFTRDILRLDKVLA